MIGELNFLFFIILLVVNYFGSTIVGKLATSLGKYVDDLARLGMKPKLIRELSKSGVNFSPEFVKYVRKARDGMIFGLEEGTVTKGIQ